MDLVEHLAELRRRILVCLMATVAGSALGYAVSPQVLEVLARPLGRFVFTAPAEALLARLRISMMIGIVIASPIITIQSWLFIAPGLRRDERRLTWRFVPAVALLFAAGVAFAYVAVYPLALRFFLRFAGAPLVPAISIGRFLRFLAAFVFPFGVAFQVPLVVYVLVRMNLLSRDTLVRSRKYVYVLVFIVAAALTPPDVVSQVLMAVPMLVLFEGTVLLTRRVARYQTSISEQHDRGRQEA
ncbi:MAG: twin-arginine translocase subunit TatC [Bacillota bacterium]